MSKHQWIAGCCGLALVTFIFYLYANSQSPTLAAPPLKSRRNLVSRLPNALIIGVKKGGTRALIEMLGLHPRIVTTANEVHYFDREENFAKGLGWYRAQMPLSHLDQVVMEKSPAYFITPGVPKRVWRLSKTMRLLLLLRNPVTRIVSDFMQGEHRRRGHAVRLSELSAGDLRSIQDGLRHRITTKDGRIKPVAPHVRIGMYERHLRRWLSVFPRNQIFVASSEEFTSNPVPVLRKAARFLGVGGAFPWEQHVKPNVMKKFYCLHYGQRAISARSINPVKCMTDTKGREHIPLPVGLERKLYEFYAPLNERLFKLLGRRFNWTQPKR